MYKKTNYSVNLKDHLIFWKQFLDVVKKEKDPIVKMVLQENLISRYMKTHISILKMFFSLSITRLAKDGIISHKIIKSSGLNLVESKLKNNTLGFLIDQLKFSGIEVFNNSNIINKLLEFKNIRDDITHNIIGKYLDNLPKAEQDVIKITKLGDQIITIQEKLINEMIDEMIKI